jgi:hypothetical protein
MDFTKDYEFISQLRNQNQTLANNVFQLPECLKVADWLRSPKAAFWASSSQNAELVD